MQTTTSAAQNRVAHDDESLTKARYVRATTQDMTVEPAGVGIYDVTHDGACYQVELESAHCECKDCEHRGVGCKHAVRAALFALYVEGPHYAFVARVAAFAREQGCPVEARDCDGPCGVGTFPCPSCVRATSTGDWTVWSRLVAREAATGTASATPRVATDGGGTRR